MIYCENISKKYGGVVAVDSVNMYAEKGEIVGIIGSNGAGKTTLFNIITGFDSQSGGDIYLQTNEKRKCINNLQPYQLAKMGMGRTFQNVRLFDDMTVYENVLAGALGTGNNIEVAQEMMKKIGLNLFGDMDAKSMPYGVRKHIELARCMASGAKLLLLDEPAAGLNEVEAMELCCILKSLVSEYDLTVVLIEHNMDFICSLCTRLYAMDLGKVISQGRPKEVIRDQRVISAVFGGGKNT